MIIVTIAYLLLVLFSIRIKSSLFNNELYLQGYNPENTNAVKGLLAIGILLSHLPIYISNELPFASVSSIGSIGVGIFLFFSGYSLVCSSKNKAHAFTRFVPKKFIRIGIPFLFVFIISLSFKYTQNETVGFFETFIKGDPYSHTWYVFAILLFYLFYYFCFRRCNFNNKASIIYRVLALTFLIFIYISIIHLFLHWPDWWFKTSLCFIVGIIFALFKPGIELIVKKYFVLLFALCVGFAFFSYFFPAFNNRILGIPESHVWLINDAMMGLSFTLLLMLLMYKMHFVNPFTTFLGRYSYEIYLWHGLIMDIMFVCFAKNLTNLMLQELFSLSVLIITIIIAVLFNKVSSCLIRTKSFQRLGYGNV